MTLTQLRHLIAVADSGSFSRSAKAMHLTQPALSRSIGALEATFKLPLFDRQGRRNELTPFGRTIVERARGIVAAAEALAGMAPSMLRGEVGTLRLGLGSGPGALLTAPLLTHMSKHHPKAKVHILRTDTGGLLDALRAGDVDALVVDARSVPPTTDLRVRTLATLRGAFLVRPGHPLLRQRKAVRFDDLLRYPMASTPLSDEVARLLVEQYGPTAHLERFTTLMSSEISGLVEVARASDTILLAVRAAGPDLIEVPIRPAMQATARYGLVTRTGRAEPPLLAPTLELIRAWLHELSVDSD